MAETERESMDFDVVVVGGGPGGLATAIALKQRAPHLSVVVLEKGAEIGAHILSGAVIDPKGLDALLPDWRAEAGFAATPVTDDVFHLLLKGRAIRMPHWLMPPGTSNHGCHTVSLGNVCRWLASKAEALGVEIYPGFAAAELIVDAAGRVGGVVTGDVGRNRDGSPGDGFQPGMSLHARYTVLAEGARGSLTKQAMARFQLASDADPQKFGIGIKELWEVPDDVYRPGLAAHSIGWPLGPRTGGGSFVYHLDNNRVAVGLVVHLDYRNPHLSPFGEFQRLKQHPYFQQLLGKAKRLSYGARAISEGGWQSVPKLAFPGGLLVGDSAGFVNVPRIKGSHNAVLSGMLAAEHLAEAFAVANPPDVVAGYDAAWRSSAVGKDLYPARNVKPLWSRFGLIGLALGGADMWLQRLVGRSLFGTLHHKGADYQTLRPAEQHRAIAYPAPDGVVTFDRASSLFLSGTNHAERQPVHLKVADAVLQLRSEHDIYGGPCARYCPAGVYEWLEDEPGGPRLQINAQNCVHCKTCDILDPNQNIIWTPPEGGQGPLYNQM